MGALNALHAADSPDRWRALGFAVGEDGRCPLGGVTVHLDPGRGRGITTWSLPEIDGLPHAEIEPAPPAEHPNGATGLDHVVVLTPDFDRTQQAFAAAELPFRRIREIPDTGNRQGFRRCGPAIVEVVEVPELSPGPARFWGLVPIVPDLDALYERLGPDLLTEPKRAVQPGRRITAVRRAAGLTCAMAFMTPEH